MGSLSMPQDADSSAPAWVPGNPNDRSIEGFRVRHGGRRGPMSKSHYYKLKNESRGPRETVLGGKIVITPLDEAAWDEARANPTGAEALLLAQQAERRRERARRGAAAAIRSPLHPCNANRNPASRPASSSAPRRSA
jgi:hypothetical protein